MASLQDIALGKNKLKHVRTTCTTADGKQVAIISLALHYTATFITIMKVY